MKIYAACVEIGRTPIGYYRNYEDAVNALYKYILDNEDEYVDNWYTFIWSADCPEEYTDMRVNNATDEAINAYNEWLAKIIRLNYFSDALYIKEIEVE